MKLNKTKLFIAMANKGITTTELAKAANMSISTISHGFTRSVLPTTAGRLSKVLDVPVGQIIVRED
ncbi:MAG: helix-turn-helix domain-containing protein [Aminipila sp.]